MSPLVAGTLRYRISHVFKVMSVIRILPYILVVVIFDMVYWVTLIIPNNLLYLGLMQNWNEVVTNNKMPLQKAIFTEGLRLVILCCNAFENRH